MLLFARSARPLSALRSVAVLIAVGVAAPLGTGLMAASSAGAAASVPHNAGLGCSTVSTAEIKSVLGLSVGKPKSVVNGSVTVCSYAGGASPQAALVRFQTGQTSSAFQAARKQFDQHGEPTKTLAGLGNAAYTSVIGAGKFVTSTVVVLQGKTELLLTASTALTKVEALAKKVLPAL